MMDGAIGRLARFDIELPKQRPERDSRALVTDADADRAVLVMRAHRDHRALEPRVRHARHGQQQLARQEGWLIHHR